MNNYDYMIRKPSTPQTTNSIFPAGSIQRQRIEKIIERNGYEVVDSYDAVKYDCSDSYKAAMIFSECNAAGLIRRI